MNRKWQDFLRHTRGVRKFSWEWTLPFLVIVAIVALSPIFRFGTSIEFFWYDGKSDSEIANSINGFSAPVIGVISAFLVYKAFMAQVTANRLTTEAQVTKNLDLLFDDIYKEIHQFETFKDDSGTLTGLRAYDRASSDLNDILNRKPTADVSNDDGFDAIFRVMLGINRIEKLIQEGLYSSYNRDYYNEKLYTLQTMMFPFFGRVFTPLNHGMRSKNPNIQRFFKYCWNLRAKLHGTKKEDPE